jgi:hypothetical protein
MATLQNRVPKRRGVTGIEWARWIPGHVSKHTEADLFLLVTEFETVLEGANEVWIVLLSNRYNLSRSDVDTLWIIVVSR